MILIISFIIGADIYWHIWEYRERKHLDECWNDLFNSKLDADRRYIDLLGKIIDKEQEQ